MSRFQKKLKDKLDDEIKLAGLEALVPEEPKKHFTLNSSRLRTFEDARLETVTSVEARFGLSRGHSDTMGVDTVNSLSSSKGKVTSSPRDGCFKCGGAHFQRDCFARKGNGKQSVGKGTQSKSWSKSEGKGQAKESKVKFTGKSKGSKGAKSSYQRKTLKTGLSGLEIPKSETSSENSGICTDVSH